MYTIEHLHHLYCSVITYFGRILAMKRYKRLHGVLLLIWVKESKKQGANTDKQEAIPCKFQLSQASYQQLLMHTEKMLLTYNCKALHSLEMTGGSSA